MVKNHHCKGSTNSLVSAHKFRASVNRANEFHVLASNLINTLANRDTIVVLPEKKNSANEMRARRAVCECWLPFELVYDEPSSSILPYCCFLSSQFRVVDFLWFVYFVGQSPSRRLNLQIQPRNYDFMRWHGFDSRHRLSELCVRSKPLHCADFYVYLYFVFFLHFD